MKKYYTVSIILIIFTFIIVQKAKTQIQFFDSINVVASSNLFDYKNPTFGNNLQYLVANSWLAYERHHFGVSDIIIRRVDFIGYGPEIAITNSQKELNINPSFSENILVWQSNIRGNWDLFYSIFLNNSWSEPRMLDSSSSDETIPYIQYNNTFPIEYNYYYLVYKKDNNIWFKRYKTSINTWDLDTNVTSDANEYATPYLSTAGNQYGVIYLRKYSNELTKINIRIFNQATSGSISWNSPYEIIQPNSQNNLTITYSYSRYITYSYDTLGSTHLLGFQIGGQNFKEVFTKNIPGKHYLGKASTMGIITDNPIYFFTVFSSLTKSNDSAQITFINRLNSFNNPIYKRIYLGDTNVNTNVDLSRALSLQPNLFRIRAVWEYDLNDYSALVESYMTDLVSSIENSNVKASSYYLFQNYPNPFNPKTVINYELPALPSGRGITNYVTLKVYDVLGSEVATLVNQKQNSGTYSVSFDGSNLSSGMYYYRIAIHSDKLQTDNFSETRKMILMK